MKKGVCVIHGEMTLENAWACKTKNGEFRLRCKECGHARRIAYYNKYKEQNIAKSNAWKKENRERVNESIRLDRISNPEKYKQWSETHRNKHRDERNIYEVTRRLGLTKEDYFNLLGSQDNKCAICLQPETRAFKGKVMRLCLDHNHDTGEVRSLLCHSCNTGIGKFKEDINLMQSAINYLKKHNQDKQ